MERLHVTQDEHDYWMVSLEKEDGTLGLIAHQFETPDKAIEIANEMVREGQVKAVVVVDPPRAGRSRRADSSDTEYKKPAPRRAGE